MSIEDDRELTTAQYSQDRGKQHPVYTRDRWCDAVAKERTVFGYWDWVALRLWEDRAKPNAQLRFYQLEDGEFYEGVGRFRNGVGFWDGRVFHGYTRKFGQWLETTAEYGETGFTPLRKIITENYE